MSDPGNLTRAEILHQPELWPDTVARVLRARLERPRSPILTGAGTSAYAAAAVEAAWPGARAVPSTELFLDPARHAAGADAVISFARSGDSPESMAVIDKLRGIRHVAFTCNAAGRLAQSPEVETVLLHPKTNDRSLAMTSSFSNLVLAGLTLGCPAEVQAALPAMCAGWDRRFASYDEAAGRLAATPPERVVVLASEPMFGAAREAALKLLEMTAGRVAPMAETYLGLRHGPMSFLRADSLALCFVSSDPARRRYEYDLVRELRAKRLGRLIGLGPADPALFDLVVTTGASGLPDCLRTPAEIVFPQLLAWRLSLRLGLDPDNPSPGAVISRVVQGVVIYD